MGAGDPIVFCVPSGNFGNLTAGLLAHRLGLPVHHFIAATNRNDVVPRFLDTGSYEARPSIATLSNAMDVGAPSNFARMADLFGQLSGVATVTAATHQKFRQLVSGYAYDDSATEEAVREIDHKYGYTIDPHGAVGYLALERWQQANPATRGVILETAHPSKFKPDVERILDREINVPGRLAVLADRPKRATQFSPSYAEVRDWLVGKFR